MITSTAKIYLADNRGKHELAWFRSYHMFNFGSYHNEHREPPGNLYVFNEDTLAGGRKFSLTVEENSRVVLIPLVGAIECNSKLVVTGEAMVTDVLAEQTLTFVNPYENETDVVNFIQLWFKQAEPLSASEICSFNLDKKDQLADVNDSSTKPVFSIGKYKGRSKGVYQKKAIENDLFVFVIDGVFEVEDRLLHMRDGLELNDFDSIEFEALSNDAIMLIIEVKNKPDYNEL